MFQGKLEILFRTRSFGDFRLMTASKISHEGRGDFASSRDTFVKSAKSQIAARSVGINVRSEKRLKEDMQTRAGTYFPGRSRRSCMRRESVSPLRRDYYRTRTQ